VSASSAYVSKSSPEFAFITSSPVGITDIGTDGNGFSSLDGYSNGNIFFNSTNASLLSIGQVFYATGSDGIDNIRFTIVSTTTNLVEGLSLFTAEVNAPLSNLTALQTWAFGYNVKTNGSSFFNGTTGVFTEENIAINSSELQTLNNASANIQTQLNSKLSSSLASSTYSPIFFPTVQATNTTDQTFTAASYQTVLFNSENFDTHDMHSNSTNTGRLTAPTGWAGYYLVSFNILTTGASGSIDIVSSTGARYYGDQGIGRMSTSCIVPLNVGDYVYAQVYFASGGNIYGTNSVGTTTPIFQATWLRPI
jgi:hypothetical protein